MASQTRTTSSGAHSTSGRASTAPAGPRTTRSNGSGGSTGSGNNTTNNNRSNNNKHNNKRHRGLWWKIPLGVIGAIIAAGIGIFIYLYATTDIPQPEKIAVSEKTTVYYDDGTTPIGSFSEQNREIIKCSTLPDYVGNAIVSSEDRSFYRNRGIDIVGMTRALINNLTQGTRQGGSTITQQYAERYYLGETTSYAGKIREAILAMKIANSQDKSEVLCNYMNTIYLGRGAYGIQAAAQAYFGKDAKDLTVSEAAMIAGIIPAPSSWDPEQNPDQAKTRFDRVIRIMKEDDYITSEQAAEAKFPEVKQYTLNNDFSGYNGYLLTTVQNELVNAKAFTKEELESGGYKVVTTLNKAMQDEIQRVGDERPEGMPETIQVGGIAVDQKTGSVKAMYAGDDYLKQQLNHATQSTFQPGSTMKPFGLIGAAQDGVSFSTLFNGNSPQTFETTPGVYAEVPNALNMSWGNINLNQATANSVNTVFMNVNEHLTPERYAKIAHEAGISGDIQTDTLYNILGINSLTVWDLAQGHSTVANNGTKNTLHIVASVTKDDKDMYKPNLNTKKVFEENDCLLVQNAMLGTTTYGTAAGTSSALGRPVAGKSGTANDETAASFVGYTPQLMSVWAIWNPGENGENMEVPEFAGYGVSSTGYPSHLFTEFMQSALADQPVEQFQAPVDSGKIGGPEGNWGLGGGVRTPSQNQSQNQGTEPQQQPSQEQSASPTPTQSSSSPAPSTSATTPAPQPSTSSSPAATPTTPAEPTTNPTESPTEPATPTNPTTPAAPTDSTQQQNSQ